MASRTVGQCKAGADRLDGVDLLRGLAIFFVLMNHVNMGLLFAKVPYTVGLPDQLVSSPVWRGIAVRMAGSGAKVVGELIYQPRTLG